MIFEQGYWLDNLLPFLRSPLGSVLFVPIYAIWVSLLLPGVWLSMFAGVLYGTWFGSALVFVGAFIGAEIAFLLGRTFLRKWVQRKMSGLPKLQAIQKAVSHQGLKLVLLTRLSPAFPFSLLNLVYGISEVSVRDYTIGLLGIIPGTVFFCGLGALAGDLSQMTSVLEGSGNNSSLINLIGITATVFVVWLVGRAAQQALQDLDSSI